MCLNLESVSISWTGVRLYLRFHICSLASPSSTFTVSSACILCALRESQIMHDNLRTATFEWDWGYHRGINWAPYKSCTLLLRLNFPPPDTRAHNFINTTLQNVLALLSTCLCRPRIRWDSPVLSSMSDSPCMEYFGPNYPIEAELFSQTQRPTGLITALCFCPVFWSREIFVLFEGRGMPLLLIYVFNILIFSYIAYVCLELQTERNGVRRECSSCLKSQRHLTLQGAPRKAYWRRPFLTGP